MMSVIFGVTFDGGAMVGADTVFHDAMAKKVSHRGTKLRAFGKNALVAKAGYVPNGDPIWDLVEREARGRDPDAKELADIVHAIGADLLAESRSKGGDRGYSELGLQFVVAGLTGGEPSIHAIQLQDDKRSDTYGIGRNYAFGVRDNTLDRAAHLANSLAQVTKDGLLLDATEWGAQLIGEEHVAMPYSVDFPGEMLFIRNQQIEKLTVRRLGMPNPRGIVRVG